MANKEKKIVKRVPVEAKKTTIKKEAKDKIVKENVVSKKKKESTKAIKINPTPNKTTKEMQELIEIRKKTHAFKLIVIGILLLILLFLLINPTFFKKQYKNDNIYIEIPRYMYLVSDVNNEMTFKTLRKSDYVIEYFEKYFNDNFITYTCEDGSKVYYNKNSKPITIVYDYEITKTLGIKTISIKYGNTNIDENILCQTK